jgi:putative ABC transport system permease protein
LIGIVLVVVMAQILSSAFDFPIFVSANILALAIVICVSIGVLAGIIPAMIAAKMDPVVAIRSK